MRKIKRPIKECDSDDVIARILTWKDDGVTTHQIHRETGFPVRSIESYWSWYKLYKSSDHAEALVQSTIPDDLVIAIRSRRSNNGGYDAKTIAQVVIWKWMKIDTTSIFRETGIVGSVIDSWWRQYHHLLEGSPTSSRQ